MQGPPSEIYLLGTKSTANFEQIRPVGHVDDQLVFGGFMPLVCSNYGGENPFLNTKCDIPRRGELYIYTTTENLLNHSILFSQTALNPSLNLLLI